MTHTSRTALLVIDVQCGMFNEPNPVFDGTRLLATIGDLIDRARAANAPIIFVQHQGRKPEHPLHPDGPGFAVHPAIAPHLNDVVVRKNHPDAFQETPLQSELSRLKITNLAVCGIQSDFCVDTTTRAAYARGYSVTLAADGHSTWGNAALTAGQIIAHENITLGGWFAQVEPAAQITF